MKKITFFIMATLLVFAIPLELLNTAVLGSAADTAVWKLIGKNMTPDDDSREGWTYKYTISDGSASYYTSTNDGDAFQTSAVWTGIKNTYAGGEEVKLTLTIKFDSFQRKTWNNVGDQISARIDVPGLAGGITAGGTALLDGSGNEFVQCKAEGGTITVPTSTATMSGVFAAGYSSGDKRSVYVNTAAGTAEYVYEWTTEPISNGSSNSSAITDLKDSGARFSDLSGQVEVLIPTHYDINGDPVFDEEAWTFAKLDMPLPEGSRIKTSDRSSVILSFADMTTFVMESETEIILLKPEARPGHLRLMAGYLWANIKHAAKYNELPIEMSQAVCGIKGTIFVLEDDGMISTLKVIEGKVGFTSKATGESVDVGAGYSVSAASAGLGDITEFDVKAEKADWAKFEAMLPSEDIPAWLIILIITGSLVLVLVTVVLIVSGRRKKKKVMVIPDAVPQHKLFCPHCGTMIPPGAVFCEQCGNRTQ